MCAMKLKMSRPSERNEIFSKAKLKFCQKFAQINTKKISACNSFRIFLSRAKDQIDFGVYQRSAS